MGWVLNSYFKDNAGQVAMTFALAAMPLLAATSVAVEYSRVTKERSQVSSALDAAVLAAANNNAITLDQKDSYAETYFRANYAGDINFALSSSVTPSRVRLEAKGELDLSLGKLIGINNPKLLEASAATLATENTICVLALANEGRGSISFDRDIEFLASGCAVHANSNAASAITAKNNISLPTASSFCAVGGISGEVEPHSKGECSSVADPYASVPPASLGICKTEILSALNAAQGEILPTDTVEINSRGNRGNNVKDRRNNANGNSAQNRGRGANSNGGQAETSALDPNAAASLPTKNPLDVIEIQKILDDKYGPQIFRGKVCDDDCEDENENENGGIEKREGNNFKVIRKFSALGGDDMQKLLAAYKAYGGELDCGDDTKPECKGFGNPFINDEYEDVPSQWVVAEVFEISYGDYLQNDGREPEIVTNGTVELIGGQLYSRNNLDNELVPISDNLTGNDIYLTPGTYCGGLTVDGLRVQFAPGDYIFKDGPLTFLNNSQSKADRVTFGFTGKGATLNIESGSSLDIRAATKGPRQGLAFMQMIDPNAPGNRAPMTGTNRIASGGKISMSGTAYFPEQTLLFSGEDTHLGANSPAVGLIADNIQFRGGRGSRVKIGVDHQKAGIPPIKPRVDDGVRLVE